MTTYEEITSLEYRCDCSVSCPGVFRSTDGKKYQVRAQLRSTHPVDGSVYDGFHEGVEGTIEIDAAILEGAIKGCQAKVDQCFHGVAMHSPCEECQKLPQFGFGVRYTKDPSKVILCQAGSETAAASSSLQASPSALQATAEYPACMHDLHTPDYCHECGWKLPSVDEAMAYADGYVEALDDCAIADVPALIGERDAARCSLSFERAENSLIKADLLSSRARITEMEKALDLCLTGGNHLANYLIGKVGARFVDDYPVGSKHTDISVAFGPSNNFDYDVWCCWDAIMRARNLIEPPQAAESPDPSDAV